jgi:3-hydroxyisobutyrate dehydrogenase-like beta-hydroxyacid dehydrogenase
MAVIAVVAMGEMGAGVAHRLVERGAHVLTSLAGRSAASAERARAAGVEIVDDAALIARADMVLSIVPPAVAATTAERFLPLVERATNKPVFIDCNAVAPQTLQAIAEPFLQRVLPFGDASIIGTAPRANGYSPRLYMCGPIAREAEILKTFGVETRFVSNTLGDAKAIKMAYAGITKGLLAIGASMALGAARAGAAAGFIAELSDSQPEIYAWLAKALPTIYAKAYRWDGEMREIAAFLEPERGAADMLSGAATLYQHIAEAHREGPQSEIIAILDRFAKPSR